MKKLMCLVCLSKTFQIEYADDCIVYICVVCDRHYRVNRFDIGNTLARLFRALGG